MEEAVCLGSLECRNMAVVPVLVQAPESVGVKVNIFQMTKA